MSLIASRAVVRSRWITNSPSNGMRGSSSGLTESTARRPQPHVEPRPCACAAPPQSPVHTGAGSSQDTAYSNVLLHPTRPYVGTAVPVGTTSRRLLRLHRTT
eukprot:4281644-Prymnesium_polylepis.2